MKIDYRLYLVTDDPSRYRGNWLDNIVSAVEGGVTCVQYRDTESDREAQYARIKALKEVLNVRKVALIVNNDAELAKAVQADGIHVGQHDMSPEEVRAIVGKNCEIGLSITAEVQLPRAFSLYRGGYVNALGVGPVFDARKTKADASEALGLTLFGKIAAQIHQTSSLPVIAIGGLTLENAAEVRRAGADSLALVSAFSRMSDSKYAAVALRKNLDFPSKAIL